ncbi:metallophosphoesterase [Mycoplasmatota bacterium zrk1]
MKILVVSDTHGRTSDLIDIIEKNKFDKVIHCGDSEVDKMMFYFDIDIVRGNSPSDDNFPDEKLITLNGLRIFITHGHNYRVNLGLRNLFQKAKTMKADIVCFGHTHVPLIEDKEGIIFINPGSLVRPRKKSKASYMIIDLENSIKITQFDKFNKEVRRYETSY